MGYQVPGHCVAAVMREAYGVSHGRRRVAHRPGASGEGSGLVLSAVPNSPGDMPISFQGRAEIERWAQTEHATHDLSEGFFDIAPAAGVSVERYTLTGPADRGKRARYPNAVCYTDGAAAAALPLGTRQVGMSQPAGQLGSQPVLLAPYAVWATARALRIVGRHAVRNAGAPGDAIIEARVFGPHMLLGYDHQGFTETYPNGLLVREVRSRLTLPLQSLAGDAQDLLIATRMTLTDVFNAFGLAEVQHIAPDGTLRVIYFAAGYNVATWAERHGVATTNENAW